MPFPEQTIRGIKRKRHRSEGPEEDRGAKLRRKLHRALREIYKVVKRARTFEVQKTVKKLKDARRKNPESDATRDLVAQVEMLKCLSYDQLAQSAFITKLKKDKILSADPTVRAVLVELSSNLVSPGTPGTPTAKVQSRILSSKILASEVISILESLRIFLRPHVGPGADIGQGADSSRASPDMSKKRRTQSGPEKDAFSSVADPSGEGSDDEFANSSGDEVDVEVDDGWESGMVGAPSESDDSVAGGTNGHDSSSEDSSKVNFPPEDTKNERSRPYKPKGQSEFLPSLSVGFARGDSSSEFSDIEVRSVDGIKKNRRGQRARRAIWEKRFGNNANHIRRQQQVTERRKPGSVPVDRRSGKGNSSLGSRTLRTPTLSRAPPHGNERTLRSTRKKPGDVKSLGSTKRRSERKGDDLRRKQEEPPLHPSWEAKRKQLSASILPSQGTKTIFSEP